MSRSVACNLDTGICEVNLDLDLSNYVYVAPTVTDKVLVEYFTDPLCSACFAFEPVINEIKEKFSNQIEFKNILGGMLPKNIYTGEKALEMADNMERMGDMFNMPISGKVMRENPVDSSYPPSLAYLAVLKQDDTLGDVFMRKLREAVYVLDKDISKEAELVSIVSELGLDTEQFLIDFYDPETLDALENDIAYTIMNGVNGFPSIVIYNPKGESMILRGINQVNDYVDALSKYGLTPNEKNVLSVDASLSNLHYQSTREIADKMDLYFADGLDEQLSAREDVENIPVHQGFYYKKK